MPHRTRTAREGRRTAAVRRAWRAVAAVVAGAAPPAPVTAPPAAAHGALESPISRAAACGPEGGHAADSPACRAAASVRGAEAPAAFDDLRVPDVRGRDRDFVPDGGLGGAAGTAPVRRRRHRREL